MSLPPATAPREVGGIVAGFGGVKAQTTSVKGVDQLDVGTVNANREQRNKIRNTVLFEEEGVIRVTYGNIMMTFRKNGYVLFSRDCPDLSVCC